MKLGWADCSDYDNKDNANETICASSFLLLTTQSFYNNNFVFINASKPNFIELLFFIIYCVIYIY